MIRGVKFITRKFLDKLIHLIDVVPYDWIIDDTELYNPGKPEGRFSGKEFEDLLKTEDDYMFVRMRRYPVGAAIADISDYNEYLLSDCSFVLLCYDGGFYEIYDKNEKETDAIYRECVLLGCDRVELATDENDGRYTFHF